MPPPITADDVLAEIAQEGQPATAAPAARRVEIQKVRYSHEDCVGRILAEPGISQGELARIYGYSQTWMSIIINSDAFQARLAERRAELVDPVLQATINDRLRAVTVRSLEVLAEKLSKPADAISDKLAIEAASFGARSMGLGAAAAPAPQATDHLAALAHRLLDLQATARPETVDVEVRRVA